MSELGAVGRTLRFGKLVDALGGVVVAVEEEVAGDEEPRFVRDGALAADVEPQIAGKEAVEPGVDHGVGCFFVAVATEDEIADLRAAEAAARQIDGKLRLEAEGIVVEKRAVGAALAADNGQTAVDEL